MLRCAHGHLRDNGSHHFTQQMAQSIKRTDHYSNPSLYFFLLKLMSEFRMRKIHYAGTLTGYQPVTSPTKLSHTGWNIPIFLPRGSDRSSRFSNEGLLVLVWGAFALYAKNVLSATPDVITHWFMLLIDQFMIDWSIHFIFPFYRCRNLLQHLQSTHHQNRMFEARETSR